ncbi:MAG: glycosyltransferase family 2 protein, partial [Bacteroidales bacterium]|nr:glycosyltransferase family 2 protein [Bacteroidales bacterium]
MGKKLSIVILNWNGRRYLEQFLPVLLSNIPDYAEVVVADNASTDDSLSFMQQNFPEIRVIVNESNWGFAKGYNVALSQIDAEYYCLLNSDIEVPSHWVEPIIEQMDADQSIAAVQPKIISYHDKTRFEYAGACGGFIDKLGYPFCRGRLFDSVEVEAGQYETPMEVFWATGAAMFVRASVYRELGGLDDDFFAHMEEIDFCWRMKNHGYKLFVNPQSVVYHIGGGTLPKNNSLAKTYYKPLKSNGYYFNTDYMNSGSKDKNNFNKYKNYHAYGTNKYENDYEKFPTSLTNTNSKSS